MKHLSRRMKRLLAILLVETIVATNMLSGYASGNDEVYTISEEEIATEAAGETTAASEETASESMEVQEEPEASIEETGDTTDEEIPVDPSTTPTDQPVAEEPTLPDEENTEKTEQEEQETTETCICEKACSTTEYNTACPVCSAAANYEDDAKEAFLKESCLKCTEEKKDEQKPVEPEIITKESNITIKGISVADGTSISGSSEFEIQVADEVTLNDQAPEITGYEFTGKAYVKTDDGDVEASKIKKETIETEKKEDGVVSQIVKETKLSYYDVNAEAWTELTEDTTVAFEYKKLEEAVEEEEETIAVNFYATCVDEDGNIIDGFEKTELTVSDSLDLTKAPVTIDGYNYVEASVDGVTATSLDKSKSTDEAGKETTVYSYTTADGKVEVTEDVTVTLSYEMTEEEKAAIHFYAECVDEKGNAIAGYEKKTLHFSGSMDLTAEPFAIDEYEYVEAAIDGTVVLSVDKASVKDEDGKETIAYSYTTADGSVEVSEDTIVTLTYKSVQKAAEVTLTWNYVDEDGQVIEGVEGEPKFEDTLVLDDAAKAPVAMEGYEYVEATIDGAVITAITKTAEEADAEAAAEETTDAEPVYSYAYTTAAGESVAIEEDTEITLIYEETGIPVRVDATIVDEFGDEIDAKYTNIELPKFADGELVLNDVENPPVAKVRVRKSLFKVIKYTYVQATIDNKIITGLKREATAATADLKEKEQEFIYSYTTDGENWTKLKEDTTVYFEYTDGKKTTYTYEDSFVSVTATLQHANAIPDDAEFVVTAITPSTGGYNYDAYMEALNANAAAISKDAGKNDDSEDGKAAFNEKNTLLYDIAFLAAPVDEEGNTIEGELVEYQPAEGSVNISISFKQKQLEEDLAAEDETDITVVHMPLSDSVKESVATTADATGISASDVNVEVVSDSTSIAGEKIDINLSDFSAVAVCSVSGVTIMKPGTSTSYDQVMGEAANYSVVANELTLSGHMETNFATGSLHGNADIQASKNSGGGAGYTYVGSYDGSNFKMTLNGNTGSLKIYTTEAAMRNFGFNMTHLNPGDSLDKLEFPSGVIVDYTTYNEAAIKSKVSSMVSTVASKSAALMETGKTEGYDYKAVKDEWNPVIDIAAKGTGSGTYYINFAEGEFPVTNYTIKIKSGQNVVLNIPDSNVSFGQFKLVVDGKEYTTQANSDEEIICESVIFNCPNATNAKTSGPTTGTFIVPNASFSNDSVAAGFLVANVITKIGGQEWHSISKKIPIVNPTSFELTAVKTVDGAAPSADENGKFAFTLYSVADDDTETVIETVRNNGGFIKFTRFDNIKQAGIYWYKIVESEEVDGYKIDNTIYYAKVIVSSVTNGLITDTNAKVVYYKNAKNGEEVGRAVFNNTTDGKIQINGSKTWNDANNQDNMRPTSITIRLWANGREVEYKTVTAADDWKWSFTDLPEKENGVTIEYTITEDHVENYETVVSGYDVINTYTPDKTSISVVKVWNDADNQDGIRPESVQAQLYADGVASGEAVTLNKANRWSYTWSDLAKKSNGQDINYTVNEVNVPDGYNLAVSGNAQNGYTLTNTHTPEKISLDGIKKWEDNNDQDEIRPDSVTMKLFADGEDTGKTAIASKVNGWKYSFVNLDKYKDNGTEIKYTVEEVPVDGYTTTVNGTTVTNSHIPEKTSLEGTKVWDDANNQDGKRPQSITVHLYADGVDTGKKVTTDASRNWKYSFENLDKYKKGVEIKYTVVEDQVEDYTTSIDGYNITNTHKPETIDISGSKIWNDNDDQDDKRPTEIIVHLYADGTEVCSRTVTEKSGWVYSFTNLPKYAEGQQGHEIVYTVREDIVEGYSTEYTEGSYDIINKYTPEETTRTVTKIWNDANDQDGLRPASVTVQLMANDKPYGDPVELNEENGWTYTWTKLPLKNKKQDIIYKVEEISKIEGYETTYSDDTFIITNTHKPAEVYVEGTKTWDDQNNQDGIRPKSITVNLLADGEQVASMVVTPTADGTWSWRFDNLPKFKNVNGTVTKIQYSIEEIKVEGYESTKDYTNDRFNLINTHKPETIDLSGTKTWNDSNNQDDKRPGSIRISLLADGVKVAEKTVTASDNWSYKFTDMPKYANGKEIRYTVTEDAVDGYTTSYSADGLSVTNSYTPERTGRSVVKIWNDSNNADKIRPASIQVQLMADGSAYGSAVTLSSSNNWGYTWTELPVKQNGKTIEYTVREITNVNGYTTAVTLNGTTFTIVNTHTVTIPSPSPSSDPSSSPSGDPSTTPASSPSGDPSTTPSSSPSGDPSTTPSATPGITPTPGSSTPSPSDPETREVLGAKRGGAVLGARRGLDQAVLGKRRRPSTGDSAAMIIWVLTLFGAMGGAAVSIVGLKKKHDKK